MRLWQNKMDKLKEQILTLIKEKPKHYSSLIQRNSELKQWVDDNAITHSNHFPSRIYSAINQVDLYCPNGNLKKLARWNQGLYACGPANQCKCTKDAITTSVSNTKQSQDHTNANTKRKETMLGKYGVEYNSQRIEVKEILTKSKIPDDAQNKLSDKNWFLEEYVTKQRTSVDISQELGV